MDKSQTIKRNKTIVLIILNILFVIILWIPVIELIFHVIPDRTNTENRVLSVFPVFSFENLFKNHFISQVEDYFNDNFGLRNYMVYLNYRIKLDVFKTSPSPSVVIGKDNWLFLSSGLSDIDAHAPFDLKNLKIIKDRFDNEYTWLQQRKIVFISLITPNKHTIYSEKLYETQKYKRFTQLDQRLLALNSGRSNYELDIRKPLIGAKNLYPTYYKNDTHWNLYGSFIAYQQIIYKLAENIAIKPLLLSDFDIQVKQEIGHADLAKMLSLNDRYNDEEIEFSVNSIGKEKLNSISKLGTLVLYGDSFMDPVYRWSTTQFLNYHFNKIIFIPDSEVFNNKILMKYKPDVVVYEIVERNL